MDRVSDPDLLADLARVKERVEVVDPQGKPIGRFERTWPGRLPPGVRSPFTDEEIEKARRQKGGLPLAEVWKIIFEKYVGDEVEPIIVTGVDAAG